VFHYNLAIALRKGVCAKGKVAPVLN